MSQNPSETTFLYGFRPYICPFGGTLALAAIFRQPETAQKLSIRKVFVSFWSIWCQTRPGVQEPFKTNTFVRCSSRVGAFGAKLALVVIFRHLSTVSQNLSNLFFVGRSSHFGPFGATTGLGRDLSASWHGVPQPFENYFFVGRSSHFGTFGAKLALVVKLRHPSTLSQNHSKTTCSQGVRPICQQNCIRN